VVVQNFTRSQDAGLTRAPLQDSTELAILKAKYKIE